MADPFDEVYERYGERLHAYLARLTGDAEWDDPAVVELLRGIAGRTAGVKETRLGEGQ